MASFSAASQGPWPAEVHRSSCGVHHPSSHSPASARAPPASPLKKSRRHPCYHRVSSEVFPSRKPLPQGDGTRAHSSPSSSVDMARMCGPTRPLTPRNCPMGGDVTSSRHWPHHWLPEELPGAASTQPRSPGLRAQETSASQQGSGHVPLVLPAHPAAELTVLHPYPQQPARPTHPPAPVWMREGARGLSWSRPDLVSSPHWLCCQVHHLLPVPVTFSGRCYDSPTLGSRPCSDVTSWQRPLMQRYPA